MQPPPSSRIRTLFQSRANKENAVEYIFFTKLKR